MNKFKDYTFIDARLSPERSQPTLTDIKIQALQKEIDTLREEQASVDKGIDMLMHNE